VSRSEAASLVLVAGSRVTLIQKDELVRIEMQGVAQGSGSVGDRVKVRLLTLSEDGGEQYAEGIIRGKDVVEMVTR
jgi:flagella basal body P-ring formation protein FlgA